MNMLSQFGENQKTMSSREIAELSGKQHGHVCRDVEALNATYEKMGLSKIGEGYYTHPNTGSQQHREFLLTKEQCIDLVTGYNAELRIKINRRWAELELQVSLPSYMIEDPIKRAEKWIEEAKQKQIAIQERDHAIATKAEIGSRREATAMSTASKYKRKAEKLEALLDESQSFATIKKVQSITGGTYDTYELRRYSKAHGLEIQKAEDANYGSVNSYHKDAWLAVYNINLSSIRGA